MCRRTGHPKVRRLTGGRTQGTTRGGERKRQIAVGASKLNLVDPPERKRTNKERVTGLLKRRANTDLLKRKPAGGRTSASGGLKSEATLIVVDHHV